jgi:signal recognition particle subunit SRP54
MERFDPRSFVRKMLGMHDMRDMIESVQDMKLGDNKKLMKNLEKGQYSLRDMYEQFQQVSKMGPLSKVSLYLHFCIYIKTHHVVKIS